MSINVEKVVKEYNLSEIEKEIIHGSGTANTAAMNQSRVASELILGKKVEGAVDKMINSNKFHSWAMIGLTGGLLFVGLITISIQLIQLSGWNPFK